MKPPEENKKVSKKRSQKVNGVVEPDSKTPPSKKSKHFSAKEFRKQLNSADKLTALRQLSSILSSDSKHDYIFDYLENGGGCLELLQTLESDSSISPAIVFDLVSKILLAISANYGQYYNSAYEACRYLLNNYLSVIQKMIGLSSSKEERKSCMKLLTAMVTFSSAIAKEVLLNVKFHTPNLELLTKNTGEKNSVRDVFIHFLTAFLVDGHYPTISLLLEKTGLLTSIIGGLKYDDADTVCIVITAMKNHILENPSVSKTVKMLVFNTLTIRDIVSLYNWKGPAGLKALEKNQTIIEVDKFEKSKVSECVHDFLLILCTSNKFGVIFRDPLVGLGKKNQNNLMYTVLESLDKPWEHSYASDLVLKICRACPDLAKNMWTTLQPFLEPRMTEKWLIALNFGKKLVNVLEPNCIEITAKNLTPYQVSQIFQILAAPLPILKIIIPENFVFENQNIKIHIISLIFDMLCSFQNCINASHSWFDSSGYKKFKKYISEYVFRNFPPVKNILTDWETSHSENLDDLGNLDTILDILNLYKEVSPQHLDYFDISKLNLKVFLAEIEKCDDKELACMMTLKIINLLIDIDSTQFLPKTELFSTVFQTLLKYYYTNPNEKLKYILSKILKNTNIFEGCSNEELIWIDGVLNIEKFDDEIALDLTNILKTCTENLVSYQEQFYNISAQNKISSGYKNVLEELISIDSMSDNIYTIKHRNLSTLIIGFLNYLSNKSTKALKKYCEFVAISLFHNQIIVDNFYEIFEKYSHCIPPHVSRYIENWRKLDEISPITKWKGKLEAFKEFSEKFLNEKIENNYLNDVDSSQTLKLHFLQAGTFYFSNLIRSKNIPNHVAENWKCLVSNALESPDDKYFEIVLGNPVLLQNFSLTNINSNSSSEICTNCVIECIKNMLQSKCDIEKYLVLYRDKVFNTILKIVRKPQKYNIGSLPGILEMFQLNFEQCVKIMYRMNDFLEKFNEQVEPCQIVYEILNYCLNRITELYKEDMSLKPLEATLFASIINYFIGLSKKNVDASSLSTAIKTYLNCLPHNVETIEKRVFEAVFSNEYSKPNVAFLIFLLERNPKFVKEIEKNIDLICEKRGILIPLLSILIGLNTTDKILRKIYDKFEPALLKAIQKPQKASQHFRDNLNIHQLLLKFMPLEKCCSVFEKIQKFEISEIFHVKLLEAACSKIIETQPTAKYLNNIIITFVHLQINIFKRLSKENGENKKIADISGVFNNIIKKIISTECEKDFSVICKNETFKTYLKFCLKFGVSGEAILLNTITNLLELVNNHLEKEELKLILEMLLSHSEFLDVTLGEHSECKLGIVTLFLTLCKLHSDFMERNHMPILLSAYRAKLNKSDRTILALLKMFESHADQTRFYDFKPFLWGRAAATHYSVKTKIENVILRQPKTQDVLNILQESTVNHTIKHLPLKDDQIDECQDDNNLYDLSFLLQLFGHILAPEQEVKTYVFIRSGALSLTVAGLAHESATIRGLAYHVLSRLYFHLEARQYGKDHHLWMRYIEALCQGAALLPDFRLNSFSAIFFANMASILSQPKHVMFYPLSRYVVSKSELNFTTVPELYTLLHSSDVNFKEHRTFILKILRDGLRQEKDVVDFLKSMAFKLISELFHSSVADFDTKILILDVIESVTKLSFGVKILCEKYSLISQMFTVILSVLNDSKNANGVVNKVIKIFLNVLKFREDNCSCTVVINSLLTVVKSEIIKDLNTSSLDKLYELFYVIYSKNSELFTDPIIELLLGISNDKYCKYMKEFGCKYILDSDIEKFRNAHFYMRLLFYNIFKKEC